MHRQTHTRNLSRTYLLEVDELGFVCVQVEAGAVVADRVSADGWWGVLELLWDVFDQGLAVHAQEGAARLRAPRSHFNQQAITHKLNISVFMLHSSESVFADCMLVAT